MIFFFGVYIYTHYKSLKYIVWYIYIYTLSYFDIYIYIEYNLIYIYIYIIVVFWYIYIYVCIIIYFDIYIYSLMYFDIYIVYYILYTIYWCDLPGWVWQGKKPPPVWRGLKWYGQIGLLKKVQHVSTQCPKHHWSREILSVFKSP